MVPGRTSDTETVVLGRYSLMDSERRIASSVLLFKDGRGLSVRRFSREDQRFDALDAV